jgi:hypothetical protein
MNLSSRTALRGLLLALVFVCSTSSAFAGVWQQYTRSSQCYLDTSDWSQYYNPDAHNEELATCNDSWVSAVCVLAPNVEQGCGSNPSGVDQYTINQSPSCPDGFESSSGDKCIESPECPDSGTPHTYYIDFNKNTATGFSSTRSNNGCEVIGGNLGPDGCTPYDPPVLDDQGEPLFSCHVLGSYTSVAAYPDSSPAPSDEPSDLSSTDNTLVTTTESVVSPPTSSTDNDGTVTDTQLVTDSTLKDAGLSVSENEQSITITDSDGSSTVYSENTVTVTHPDGSITETVTKDTQNNTGDKSQVNIDKQNFDVVIADVEGQFSENNEVTVTEYSSGGTKTGSTSTGSGTGSSGDTGDSEKPGNCGAPGQPVCDVTLSDNSDEYSNEASTLDNLKGELETANADAATSLGDSNEDYGAGDINGFSVDTWVTKYTPFPTSGSCQGEINTTFLNKSFVLAPCEPLQPLRDILSWVFFILTIFAVIKITLDRKII